MAGKFDIEVEQGSAFEMKLTFPMDLSYHVFTGQIRRNFGAREDLLGAFTFEVGNQSMPAQYGVVFVRLTALQTALLPTKKRIGSRAIECVYDIVSHVRDGGEAKRWLEGRVNVSQRVTR